MARCGCCPRPAIAGLLDGSTLAGLGWPRLAGRGSLPYTDAMSPLDRITIDQSVRFGKPCVRGTRITVGDVLSYLAAGMTEAEVVAEFPQLTGDDIRACLAYAAERERRSVSLPAA
jgi:uncharacterized protein (DUF433 family)